MRDEFILIGIGLMFSVGLIGTAAFAVQRLRGLADVVRSML